MASAVFRLSQQWMSKYGENAMGVGAFIGAWVVAKAADQLYPAKPNQPHVMDLISCSASVLLCGSLGMFVGYAAPISVPAIAVSVYMSKTRD